MQIIFLNTWHGKLRQPLIEFIKRESRFTDVFCFQEADPDVRRMCRGLLEDFQELSADKKLPLKGSLFGQAMYAKRNITITESGVLLQNAQQSGIALYAKLERGSESFSVCNTHGISFHNVDDKLDTPGRILHSSSIIDHYRDVDEPVVIGGDFNLLPAAESIKMFGKAGYHDLIHDFQISTTRNHYAWDQHPDTIQYFADYIFTSPGIQTEAFEVAEDLVSDHLPLILKMSLAPAMVPGSH